MRSVSEWKRLGSEAESEDRRRGHTFPIDDGPLREVLSDHFADDLNNPEICEDFAAALDALCDGYRTGPAGKRSVDLVALIPLPVKTAHGEDLPPWEWSYPRSEAYEAAASAVLPAGWRLYSVIDAGHENAAKDFGATRDDGRAHVFGVRAADGEPSRLRACLPRAASFGQDAVEQTFEPGDLAAACAWCDEQLASRAT